MLTILPMQVMAMEPEDDSNEDSVYVCSYDLGNGLTCEVYEIAGVDICAAGTVNKTYDFNLYYAGTYFGYYRQATSWSYDGVNRPTLLSYSNTFYSTDLSNHYVSIVSHYTANEGTSSKKYNRKEKVYYNRAYIATTNFATICDKNGNCSSLCIDD